MWVLPQKQEVLIVAHRKFVAILLAALILVSVAACGPAEDPETTTAVTTAGTSGGTTVGTSTSASESEATTTEGTVEPEFRTFGGRTFVVGGQGSGSGRLWTANPEESALEAEKQAIFDELEKDLDINLEFIRPEGIEDMGALLASLFAGDVPSDILFVKMQRWMPLAIKELILPWDDPRIVASGLDTDDPSMFFQPYTQTQTYNDRIYGVMWTGSHMICEFGWCIYFNKQLVADAGTPDLYQVVRDGKWDWDFFLDLAKKTTIDTNNDGTPEIYGVGTFGYGTELFTWPGAEIIRNEGGKMKVVLNENAALSALEFTRKFAYAEGIRHPEPFGPVHRAFNDGEVALVWGEYKTVQADDLGFKDSEIDWGLVPMPKAPGADYYVNVLGGVYSTQIFSGHSDQMLEDNAYILAEIARRFTNDEWQDTYLTKYLHDDEEALEMVLDYIWPNTVVDYVWASDAVRESFRQNIYLPMTEGHGSPKQLVEQFESELQGEVDALFGQ